VKARGGGEVAYARQDEALSGFDDREVAVSAFNFRAKMAKRLEH
jgi:hypothetical protein